MIIRRALSEEKKYKKVAGELRRNFKKSNIRALVGMCVIFFMTTVFSFQVYQTAQMVNYKLNIAKLTNFLNKVNMSNEKLNLKVAKLKSLPRIEKIAKMELNMTHKNVTFLKIKNRRRYR